MASIAAPDAVREPEIHQLFEAIVLGEESEEQQQREKIRRQKRKRSRRAKEKILRDKKLQSEKKSLRTPPHPDD